MHNLLKHTSLKRQFELRQAAWKPNMDIQLTPPYRVDSVLTGEYVPPNAENCVEMQCFDMEAWQEFVHHNNFDSCFVFDKEGFEEAVKDAYEAYLKCKMLCATEYCLSQCDRTWEEAKQDILDYYGPPKP